MVTDAATDVRRVISSVRCGATVKATGERCKRYATPGTTVCRMHGASAPQVRRKAMTTNVIAQMLAQDARPVEQVVIDAIHNVDVVMRDHVAKIEQKDDVSVKDLGRLVNLSQVAHSLASSAVTQKLLAFRLHEAHADVVMTRLVFSAVLDALGDHLSPRGLGSQTSAFRWWMLRIIQAALTESMVQGRNGLGYESEQPRRSPSPTPFSRPSPGPTSSPTSSSRSVPPNGSGRGPLCSMRPAIQRSATRARPLPLSSP